MDKLNVAVIYGGYTAEKNISIGSGQVVNDNIDNEKYNVYKVMVEERGCFVQPENLMVDLSDFSFKEEGKKKKFDLVFNAIHGSPGEDGKIQGYFDMLHIPYTNCGVATSAITFNKGWTKDVLKNEVLLAKSHLVSKNNKNNNEIFNIIQQTLSLPLFVKPNNNGSSYGISKIKKFEDLENAVKEALKFDFEVLVEEGISGKEVTCGVYQYKNEIIVLPICEIVADKHEFFDYKAKYTSGESDEIIPARLHEKEKNLIVSQSSRIYSLLNCRGVVRIDFIIKDGAPYFLEVNTVPGLSEMSIVPKMAIASGLTLKQFLGQIAWKKRKPGKC